MSRLELQRGRRVEELFEGTRIDQVEKMLAFLGSVYTALWQAFINGEELPLKSEPHSVQEMRKQAIDGVRGRTAQENIVREARDCLRYAARVD